MFVFFCCGMLIAQSETDVVTEARSSFPKRVVSRNLPNLIQLHDKVFSGGLPDGDDAFRELQRMGIRSIISVDGQKPDVETRSDLICVTFTCHGYDGISAGRGLSWPKQFWSSMDLFMFTVTMASIAVQPLRQ
ncbi:MAG: hypothetical protein R3C03_10275 [Pirellulaceae bacterium]